MGKREVPPLSWGIKEQGWGTKSSGCRHFHEPLPHPSGLPFTLSQSSLGQVQGEGPESEENGLVRHQDEVECCAHVIEMLDFNSEVLQNLRRRGDGLSDKWREPIPRGPDSFTCRQCLLSGIWGALKGPHQLLCNLRTHH